MVRTIFNGLNRSGHCPVSVIVSMAGSHPLFHNEAQKCSTPQNNQYQWVSEYSSTSHDIISKYWPWHDFLIVSITTSTTVVKQYLCLDSLYVLPLLILERLLRLPAITLFFVDIYVNIGYLCTLYTVQNVCIGCDGVVILLVSIILYWRWTRWH
jgi:hypothetical protein